MPPIQHPRILNPNCSNGRWSLSIITSTGTCAILKPDLYTADSCEKSCQCRIASATTPLRTTSNSVEYTHVIYRKTHVDCSNSNAVVIRDYSISDGGHPEDRCDGELDRSGLRSIKRS